MHAHVGFLSRGEIHQESWNSPTAAYWNIARRRSSGSTCHDGWVVGNEPVVLMEFDFGSDTVRNLGVPEKHSHTP